MLTVPDTPVPPVLATSRFPNETLAPVCTLRVPAVFVTEPAANEVAPHEPVALLLNVTLAVPPLFPQLLPLLATVTEEPLPSTESVPVLPVEATSRMFAEDSKPPVERFTWPPLMTRKDPPARVSRVELVPVML